MQETRSVRIKRVRDIHFFSRILRYLAVYEAVVYHLRNIFKWQRTQVASDGWCRVYY